MTCLGYQDGALCNTSMIEIAEKIERYIRQLYDDSAPDEVELMSLELGGISGHIDHIVASRAACLAFIVSGSICPLWRASDCTLS